MRPAASAWSHSVRSSATHTRARSLLSALEVLDGLARSYIDAPEPFLIADGLNLPEIEELRKLYRELQRLLAD